MLTLTAFLAVSVVGCEDSKPQGVSDAKKQHTAQEKNLAKGGKGTDKSIPVEVMTPINGTATSVYKTTTTLSPNSDANINARTSGVVRRIIKEEGDDVKKGDVLLLLEDDDQVLRLKRAKQELESAEKEYNRLSKKKDVGVVSTNEWESAEKAYKTTRTEKELAELALSYTKIVAPFDGRVVWREVDYGTHVREGDLLFRMMSINPLLARVHVPSSRLGFVALGHRVQLDVDNLEQPIWGRVDLVSPIVDPLTGTVKVTVRIDQYPNRVRPGDFVEVKIVTDERKNAMLLPFNAVLEERGQHYVYIAHDGVAVKKNILAGYTVDDKIEVRSGIDPDHRVVIKGQRNLNDNTPVEILSSAEEPKQTTRLTTESYQ